MKARNPDSVLEWIDLGERLASANPARYAKLVKMVRDIVESQEMLASVPAPLRTVKSFRRRRYTA